MSRLCVENLLSHVGRRNSLIRILVLVTLAVLLLTFSKASVADDLALQEIPNVNHPRVPSRYYVYPFWVYLKNIGDQDIELGMGTNISLRDTSASSTLTYTTVIPAGSECIELIFDNMEWPPGMSDGTYTPVLEAIGTCGESYYHQVISLEQNKVTLVSSDGASVSAGPGSLYLEYPHDTEYIVKQMSAFNNEDHTMMAIMEMTWLEGKPFTASLDRYLVYIEPKPDFSPWTGFSLTIIPHEDIECAWEYVFWITAKPKMTRSDGGIGIGAGTKVDVRLTFRHPPGQIVSVMPSADLATMGETFTVAVQIQNNDGESPEARNLKIHSESSRTYLRFWSNGDEVTELFDLPLFFWTQNREN